MVMICPDSLLAMVLKPQLRAEPTILPATEKLKLWESWLVADFGLDACLGPVDLAITG